MLSPCVGVVGFVVVDGERGDRIDVDLRLVFSVPPIRQLGILRCAQSHGFQFEIIFVCLLCLLALIPRSCSRLQCSLLHMAANISSIPTGASSAVLKPSDPVPEEAVAVQGPNFDEPLTLEQFLGSYERIGFQANHLGKAINVVNKMVR